MRNQNYRIKDYKSSIENSHTAGRNFVMAREELLQKGWVLDLTIFAN